MAVIPVNGRSVTVSRATGSVNRIQSFVTPQAGSQDQVWVEILDNNLVSQGVVQFATLSAQLYYNAVGSWSMVVPYSDTLWNRIMSGDFFVNINWRGLFSFGGKCEQPGYQDSIPGSTGGSGSVSGPFIALSGADWLGLIANRICYPNPAVAWASQTAAATDAISGVTLETAIKHYVNNNIGPGALAARVNPLLDIAANQTRGPSGIAYTVKFGTGVDLNLLDVIRALIAQGGSAMGVQVTRNAPAHRLTFDVYIPRNLSGKAWFSRDLGNLAAISFALTDPTCTDALVQGSGTQFISRVASAKTQWNVVEQFVDSSSETDANNLASTAQQTLLTGAAGPTMSATATDTPFLTFGRDYGLGDIVSMEVRNGAVYSDVVTAVTLTADGSQTPVYSVVPSVGQSSIATATDQSVIGQLTKRIQVLERKLATKLWLHTTDAQALSRSCRQRLTGKTSCHRPELPTG